MVGGINPPLLIGLNLGTFEGVEGYQKKPAVSFRCHTQHPVNPGLAALVSTSYMSLMVHDLSSSIMSHNIIHEDISRP